MIVKDVLVEPRVMQPTVTERVGEAQPADVLSRLFNSDGTALIPDETADTGQQKVQDGFAPTITPSLLLRIKRPLRVRPNHFAAAWVGGDALADFRARQRVT